MAVPHSLVTPDQGDHLTPPPTLTGAATRKAEEAAAEALLGHRFARPDLLREALTHRSAASVARATPARATPGRSAPGRGRAKGAGSNERLEFIGDRVLGLLIAEWLAERYAREQEGALGLRLALLVSQPVLAGIGERIGLPAVLTVASGEAHVGVRRLATVLADAMEAAIGALYLDGGLDVARGFVRQAWESAMEDQTAPPKDAKTALQEWAQGRGHPLPDYEIVSRTGPSHAPIFVIAVEIDGRRGSGTAGNKRAAEMAAATDLMGQLK